MKLLVILFVPLTCFCQQQPGQSFVYSNSGFTWSTLYISKVDSFATCSTFKTNTVSTAVTLPGGSTYTNIDTYTNSVTTIQYDGANSVWRAVVNL